MTRKDRGMRTQKLLAQRWCQNGLFPYAVSTGSGRAGKDILHTPGISAEVKARGRLTLVETLRQAENNAAPGELAIVVWRHNGQGEVGIADWTVTMRLSSFENLWRVTQ